MTDQDAGRHGDRDGAEHGEVVLRARGVVMRFGGLLALGGVDLDVRRGERLAVLGPNGAGKTTLFNVLAGDLRPTRGTVTIMGVDCTAQPSRRRPRLGVARTYQQARSFAGLTVSDNLYLALLGKRGRHLVPWRTATDAGWREEAARAAATVWLHDQLGTPVADLSHGQKRQLELGMAMVTEPDVLLLDEPASGLSRGERERLVELLDALPTRTTLLLIEHDMDVAFRVAHRVLVMSDGRQIAHGTPAEIRSDEQVQGIYLGSQAAA